MGLSSAEVEQMVRLAHSRNLFLMEAMWTRFIPAIEKVLELISAGAIGEPFSVRADFGFRTKVEPYGRLFNKELGGGSLMDIGIYPIYLALLLFGKPDRIKAVSRMTNTGVDAFCAMLFDYKGGQKAVLESSIESHMPTEAFVYGTGGHIRIHRRFHQPEKISVHQGECSVKELTIPYTGNGYLHEIIEVNKCILKGDKESSKHPLRMSMDLISVLDRVKAEIGLEY
jgi:predicted dehydrogenase